MPNPQLILISRNLIDVDIPVSTGHVLVRCHDNRWRFIDSQNPRNQQRGKVVNSDFKTVTIRITETRR